ncbi:hypothetical protein IAI10_05395 [Clostridium sp. 19966]|uniref:hypothetical protein n=1 Tax=Clostridium sp. 19966 TaxID=2768166 RepID=UPI0028DE5420|nr:hypothetical protein [Clostridium sp. 19966]MDT8716081.1 hypothetical protein [Clostridium sp. 19966]
MREWLLPLIILQRRFDYMKKEFKPQMEIFDPFKEPFSTETEVVFDLRDMDACCACTACSACSACK